MRLNSCCFHTTESIIHRPEVPTLLASLQKMQNLDPTPDLQSWYLQDPQIIPMHLTDEKQSFE